MAEQINKLTQDQEILDMTNAVNAIIDFVNSSNQNSGTLTSVSGGDLTNPRTSLPPNQWSYSTRSIGAPNGESYTGYVNHIIRDTKYSKLIFIPFNTNTAYIKTENNGVWGEWEAILTDKSSLQRYMLTDNNGQLPYGKLVDIKTLKGTQKLFGTLVEPPKEGLEEGWIDYTEAVDKKSTITNFYPINSSSVFTKIQRMPVQTQNPNLIEDSLFLRSRGKIRDWKSRPSDYTWDTVTGSDISITEEVTYKGFPTVRITGDGTAKYPIIRTKPLTVGTDVNVGDTLTLSAYLYVPDKSKMLDNVFYIQVNKYTDSVGDVNNSIQSLEIKSTDIENNKWKRFSLTVTVPSDAKYIASALRINTSKSGTGTGMVGYYAFPKLEKGDTATPFITNSKDTTKYDTIFTNWEETKSNAEMNRLLPSDISNNSFFDYVWDSNYSEYTFEELVSSVPQGLHTFYVNNKVQGISSPTPLRGTILLDYVTNDPSKGKKGVITAIDTKGDTFTFYYERGSITLPKKAISSTYLWSGTQDLSEEGATMNLEDAYTNYDYLEITVNFANGQQGLVIKQDTSSSYMVVRAQNLSNASTVGNPYLYEGVVNLDPSNPRVGKVAFSKSVKLDASKNTIELGSWNLKGEIIITHVTGINML